MSFDLSSILKFLARAILKLVQERLAKNAVPEPAPPASAPPAAPTVEVRATTPSDRVLAAVVDLKLDPRASQSKQADVASAAAALSTQSLADDARSRGTTAALGAVPDAERERFRQAALETQENWRSKRLLAALAERTGTVDLLGTPSGAGKPNPSPTASTAADKELSQAQANLRAALQAYRALESA
ncbi:hypothetical protein [Jiella pacifica]|uniref:Uncharacterized protein n=1 Tax=Jiella pacifica TaxID=2696469 RepID=A0A6N9T8A2_9HYPH|nr:hypothetical protein [Jiella pacifica]NDW07451.1 hypothetical protein [Jiella pacifica]